MLNLVGIRWYKSLWLFFCHMIVIKSSTNSVLPRYSSPRFIMMRSNSGNNKHLISVEMVDGISSSKFYVQNGGLFQN